MGFFQIVFTLLLLPIITFSFSSQSSLRKKLQKTRNINNLRINGRQYHDRTSSLFSTTTRTTTTTTSSNDATSNFENNPPVVLTQRQQERPFFFASAITQTAPPKKKNVSSRLRRETITGPPSETKPDHSKVYGPMGKFPDELFLKLFRTRMAEQVGVDSSLPKNDYNGLIELTGAMNSLYSDRLQVQKIAQNVLVSLFPSWLPGSFSVLFATPFPAFSARMNAWATRLAGTWLMGECEVNDCEIDDGKIGINQGVLVKRCRFLEESGPCASVCVNSCKIPTQQFFIENMGLPLTMTPDYETFECQFSFGLTPDKAGEIEARDTPCFERCPSAGGLKMWHDGVGGTDKVNDKCGLMDK